jgi:hypothetical protein
MIPSSGARLGKQRQSNGGMVARGSGSAENSPGFGFGLGWFWVYLCLSVVKVFTPSAAAAKPSAAAHSPARFS